MLNLHNQINLELTVPQKSITVFQTKDGSSFSLEQHRSKWYTTISTKEGSFSFKIPDEFAYNIIADTFTQAGSKEEIERRFLCDIPEDVLNEVVPVNIKQWYLLVGEDLEGLPIEIRFRIKNNKPYLTIKRGKGICRLETEGKLFDDSISSEDLKQFRALEKQRYTVKGKVPGVNIEYNRIFCVDEIKYLAEVEFETLQEANSFLPPTHFGKEVTEDTLYASVNLAF